MVELLKFVGFSVIATTAVAMWVVAITVTARNRLPSGIFGPGLRPPSISAYARVCTAIGFALALFAAASWILHFSASRHPRRDAAIVAGAGLILTLASCIAILAKWRNTGEPPE